MDTRATGQLTGLALGTLNTCLFVLAAVLLLHIAGSLGELLDGLSTAIGLGIFALLWSVTCFCTYQGRQEMGGETLTRAYNTSVKWGAFNGIAFFLGLLAGVLAVALAEAIGEGDGNRIAGVFLFGLTAFGAGAIVAGAFGLVFGIVFGLVDLLLLKTARMLTGIPFAPASGADKGAV